MIKPIWCGDFHKLDAEIKEDFGNSVKSCFISIERSLHALRKSHDSESINGLFRSVHSLKGNCAMVFLDDLCKPVHELEFIIEDVRNGTYTFTDENIDYFRNLVAMLANIIKSVVSTDYIDIEIMNDIIHQCRQFRESDEVRKKLLEQHSQNPSSTAVNASGSTAKKTENTDSEDMRFFVRVASRIDELSIFRKGRTEKIETLCMQINQSLDTKVDEEQLRAAIYLHDLGMVFISHDLLMKSSKFEADELREMQSHVAYGSGFLKRMKGWSEASKIAQDHHEWSNGEGYPNRLSGNQIHLGARILSIADAFFSMCAEREGRRSKKSLFHAVTEINVNKNRQFDGELVEAFNLAVRTLYIKASTAKK